MRRIIKVNEKILTVYDVPIENDAFECVVGYADCVEIYLNKTLEDTIIWEDLN